MNKAAKHILVAEPCLRGHHLSWLKYIVEDFLSLGCKVSLITDNRPEPALIIKEYLGLLAEKIEIFPFYDCNGKFLKKTQLATMAKCVTQTGADQLFVNNLDAIISVMLRSACLRKVPPKSLRGKINGIYMRPRFLVNPYWPMNNFLKSQGFKHLDINGWFNHLFLLDEYLLKTAKRLQKQCQFHFLPDTWHGAFNISQISARNALNLPPKKYIFLNYGIGDRRKGLHLVIEAFLRIKNPTNIFLLCAGTLSSDQQINEKLQLLINQGKAALLNRYVSDHEEQLCFAACDSVTLPYIGHFGSSGVLSRATAAGKPILASSEGLVGKRVKEYNLGLLFQTGSVSDLQQQLINMVTMKDSLKSTVQYNCQQYSKSCNRQAFKKHLMAIL